jgi:hypothetical protein
LGDEGSSVDQGGQGASAPAPAPAKAKPPQVEAAGAQPATSTIDLDKVISLWPAVLDNVRESGAAMLSSVFEGTKLLAVDSEKAEVKIGFPPSATFNKRKAEAKANIERMTESLRETLGQRLRPVYELLDGDAVPEKAKDEAPVSEEELVELLKTKFDAHEVVDEEKRSAEG